MNPDPFEELLEEDEPDELVAKEMFDATYQRVDVVKGPASGMRFIVLKAQGDQDPEAIAQLTSSADPFAELLAATDQLLAEDVLSRDRNTIDKANNLVDRILSAEPPRRTYVYRDGIIFLNGRAIAKGTRNSSGGWSYSAP